MLALVLFDDGIYYICKQTDISCKGDECTIRYKGSRYAGTVVALNGKLIHFCKVKHVEASGGSFALVVITCMHEIIGLSVRSPEI